MSPIHAKAMPVLLTAVEEWDTRLTGSTVEALALQMPLPNEKLRIVAMGEKSDQAPVDLSAELPISRKPARWRTARRKP